MTSWAFQSIVTALQQHHPWDTALEIVSVGSDSTRMRVGVTVRVATIN